MKKISIITATYNSQATIKDTLDSVSNQSYNNIEHIIKDGLSKDDTLDIVARYPHVNKVVSKADDGIYDAMNKGIKLVSGEIVGILNSDDIYDNDQVIQNVCSLFLSDDSIDLVYGNISFFKEGEIDKVQRKWNSKPYYDEFFEDGEVPPHPALFVKKKVYDEIGCFYPKFKIASDYEFMLRSIKVHKYKAVHLNKNLVKMRLGGDSTSGIHNLILNNKEVLEAWKMNDLKPPLKFYIKRPLKKIKQLFT